MERALIEIVADYAMFLELSDDSVLDPDLAIKLEENLMWRLRGRLTSEERKRFVTTLRGIADEQSREGATTFLRGLAADLADE